ncbi:derlin-1 [Polychytrium aggregatum]|uniref:derlin-1 n=1 Tax=Polychytrium aggregatum TaxID=110093 RepID=UPI0022FEB290|nr:derlin-1 [Polychytrium aggregatum]KAI9193735.1 derlin-1 [Polychytrium aggregatum]
MPPPPPPPQRNIVTEIQAWLMALPIVTRFLFVSTITITLVCNIGLISPQYMIFRLPLVVYKLQVWRLFTAFFVNQLSFNFLIHLYFLYQYSKNLETSLFSNRPADYAFFIAFSMATILILGWIVNSVSFSESLLLAIIYVWSQYFREMDVSFMFGVRFKAVFLPWAMVAMDYLMGYGLNIGKVVGILVGHFYYFLEKVYPESNGQAKILQTPAIFERFLPSNQQGGDGQGYTFTPPNRQNGPNGPNNGGHSWGPGRRL